MSSWNSNSNFQKKTAIWLGRENSLDTKFLYYLLTLHTTKKVLKWQFVLPFTCVTFVLLSHFLSSDSVSVWINRSLIASFCCSTAFTKYCHESEQTKPLSETNSINLLLLLSTCWRSTPTMGQLNCFITDS